MRKILLLSFIGGIGFTLPVFNSLHIGSHSTEISYLQRNCRDVGILIATGDGDGLFSKIAPRYACSRIFFKSVPARSLPSATDHREQELYSLTDLHSASGAAYLLSNISTVTTLHFNRMVNRKRILLSG